VSNISSLPLNIILKNIRYGEEAESGVFGSKMTHDANCITRETGHTPDEFLKTCLDVEYIIIIFEDCNV